METKIERERKWLLKRVPDEAYNHTTMDITQLYTEDGWRYRETVPISDTTEPTYEKLKKISVGRGINQEVNIQKITRDEFLEIYEQENVKGVRKYRHVVDGHIHTYEFDDFISCNLAILEVEDVDMDDTIVFPDWVEKEIIMEVTGNPLFSNANLAIDAKEL